MKVREAVLLTMLILLSACAQSLERSKQDLDQTKPTEGIVFGSITVKVKESVKEGFSHMGPGGPRAEDLKYTFKINKVGSQGGLFPLVEGPVFTIEELGKEKRFIVNLEEGAYEFLPIGISRKSFSFSNLPTAQIGARFVVTAGRTSYLGHLVVTLPEELQGPVWGTSISTERFTFAIEDAQEKTVKAIRDEYPEQMQQIIKDMIFKTKSEGWLHWPSSPPMGPFGR